MPKKVTNKGTFVMRDEWERFFFRMSAEKAGYLIKAVYDYHINGVDPEFEDDLLAIAFETMRESIKYTDTLYEEKSLKNAINAKIRQNNEHKEVWYYGLAEIVMRKNPSISKHDLLDILNQYVPKEERYLTLEQL